MMYVPRISVFLSSVYIGFIVYISYYHLMYILIIILLLTLYTILCVGICDFGTRGASSPASCCEYCNKLVGCQAFVYLSNICFFKSCKESTATSVGNVPDAWTGVLRSV